MMDIMCFIMAIHIRTPPIIAIIDSPHDSSNIHVLGSYSNKSCGRRVSKRGYVGSSKALFAKLRKLK